MGTKLGTTYFCGTTAATASYQKDMDALKARGVYLLRVCVNWNQPAGTNWCINSDGTLNGTNVTKLKTFIATARSKGLVVDCSIFPKSTSPPFTSFTTHKTGVTNFVTTMRGIAGVWCIDVANEFYNAGYTASQVAQLLVAARAADGSRGGFTASCDGTPSNVVTQYKALIAALGGNYKYYLGMFAPHGAPRDGTMARDTRGDYTAIRTGLASYGLPIYAQEEGRWNNPFTSAQNFYDSGLGARLGGNVTVYVFHTKAGYDLTGTKQYMTQLNSTEATALGNIQAKAGLS